MQPFHYDQAVLCRLAWLDKLQLYTFVFTPAANSFGEKLSSVIRTNLLRSALHSINFSSSITTRRAGKLVSTKIERNSQLKLLIMSSVYCFSAGQCIVYKQLG